jgi:hypothetical protein
VDSTGNTKMKKSINKNNLRSMIIKEMKNILESEHGDPVGDGSSEEAIAGTIAALKAAADEESGAAGEELERVSEIMPPDPEEFYLGDLEDAMNSQVFHGKMNGVSVDDMVAVMLSAASDEMRNGYGVQSVLQAVQKWLASTQDDIYRR